MLPILKNSADPLRQYRSTPNASYDNCPKEALKDSLLREQNFLCAYCMARITNDTMSIEHWKCQADNRELELSYSNLLAVCNGNEGQPLRKQHCDTRKGSRNLTYNPANSEHHARLRIRYTRLTGKIESEDTAFCLELGGEQRGAEGVLNLNYKQIMNNRLAVIGRVEQELNKLPQNAKKSQIRQLIERWKTVNGRGELPEYAGVAIYFLEKRLARAQ